MVVTNWLVSALSLTDNGGAMISSGLRVINFQNTTND
jgi:hypothetical protein